MPVTLSIKRTIGGFVPNDAESAELMEELPMGKPIKAICTVARSNPQNRWFHKVLRELFNHQDTWPTEKLFKRAVKRALGYVDTYVVWGKEYYEERSIAFHKMDGHEFNQLVERFIKLVCTRIIPKFDEKATLEMFELLDANTGALGKRIAA